METLSNRYNELQQNITNENIELRQLEGAFKELEILVKQLEVQSASETNQGDNVAPEKVTKNGTTSTGTASPTTLRNK